MAAGRHDDDEHREERDASCGQASGAITDARGRELAGASFDALESKYGAAYAIDRGALHAVLAGGLEELCARPSSALARPARGAWRNRAPRQVDRPIGLSRKWAQQFYE